MMLRLSLFLVLAPLASCFVANTLPSETSTCRPMYTPDFTSDYAHENDLVIPNRIGVTTRYWGDPSKGFIARGSSLSDKQRANGKFLAEDAQEAVKKLVEEGIKFIDTSEQYGKGTAEKLLEPCLDDVRRMNPIVAASYRSTGFRTSPGKVFKSLRSSLRRLGVEEVELYQAKRPLIGGLNAMARGFVEAIDEGYCTRVGAVGLGASSMKRLQQNLKRRGEFLATNAFEFSLTNRKNMKLIDACKDLGVTPLVFNPLDKNRLASGMYTVNDLQGGKPSGPKPFGFGKLEKLNPLHVVQETVAERAQSRAGFNQGRKLRGARGRGYQEEENNAKEISSTQVAINYIVAKGGVPMVDVYDTETAEELIACLGWRLTDDEIKMLDSAADLVES